MVGSGGSSSARVGGEDRFYTPPAVRKQRELQKQQRLQQQLLQQQKEATSITRPSPPAAEARVAEERFEPDDASLKPSVSSSSSPSPSPSPTPTPTPPLPPSPVGNLDQLLESTTPVVPARYFPKASTRGRRNGDELDPMPHFCLSDLWESFKEWSAYGAGVPLVMNGSDSVVQYYVPYLSAIQLYVDASATTIRSRRSADRNDGNHYLDTSSEGSSGSVENQSTEVSSSLGGANHTGQGGFANDAEASHKPALLVFEFFEKDPPYGREPLADKISVLANKFPDLETYKSCDMLPPSWMSVAWYPIYRIPTGPTLRDLDACFLTFHSLTNAKNNDTPPLEVLSSCTKRSVKNSNDRPVSLRLPVFGLASYKFRGSIWTSCSLHDERQLASSLFEAADNWLRRLQVDHPDYRFFLSHSNSFRR
ncbi:hypothetical protein Cni_G11996 [Canna indica]|uniref:Uncharacterized protein n=1 Tax=Canna indica TaxID=4628 RepID=A0AAQ3Q8M2_9LILI|nr:hypothetical protein Cni_G11996 [Canna indica]